MMHWKIVDDYEALSAAAAQILLESIERNPSATLLLPTGSTPEGMYAHVVSACSARYRCFSGVTTFNLDEYVGVSPDHPGSYHHYMRTRLFSHVDLDPDRTHLPDGTATEVRRREPELDFESALRAECASYERAIEAAGGIDVAFLGMGRNGHIGFNEPGSPFESRTRIVTLDPSTRMANAPYFPEGTVPERAITAGIGTILDSRRIILMASGGAKAPAVKRLAEEAPSRDFPAAALRLHSNVTVIVDRAAAAALPVPPPAST